MVMRGSVTETRQTCKLPEPQGASRRRLRRRTPLRHGLRTEHPKRAAGDLVALDVERVVGGGVHGDEALGGAGRLETPHLAFPPPHWLVRNLGPVVFPQALLVAGGDAAFGARGAAGARRA